MAREFEGDLVEAIGMTDSEPQADVVVAVGGRDILMKYPNSGQMAYMAMASAEDRSNLATAGKMINFVLSLMENIDARYVREMLLDHGDEFGMEELLEVFDEIMEQWSARPTESPTASLPTRQGSGRSSTATSRRAASPRSASRGAGS